ncbi:flagellar assembly protein FliX [Siculibacillus lacustris]|uniref:flagellar assembly protein FliX n=1 Tax=Siculibacillus lacustris TaxID=1549641 RepID=UPI0013F14728|nr:flagellar assembly protein FliX [Siculibacillus lacustris]
MAIRIDGPGRTPGVQPNQPIRRGGEAGAAFSLPNADGGPARPATIAGALGVQDLASLLALQQIPSEDPRERRRRAVKRGFDLLDVLEGVKIDLLSGGVPIDRLERLVHLLGQKRPAEDAELDALVAEIELRARVELAKYGRFPE